MNDTNLMCVYMYIKMSYTTNIFSISDSKRIVIHIHILNLSFYLLSNDMLRGNLVQRKNYKVEEDDYSCVLCEIHLSSVISMLL
jgi:hypothetical protein